MAELGELTISDVLHHMAPAHCATQLDREEIQQLSSADPLADGCQTAPYKS
jgi:hypothetical protein